MFSTVQVQEVVKPIRLPTQESLASPLNNPFKMAIVIIS